MPIIKNVSIPTTNKKNPSLREFKKILPSTLIYNLILINKTCMNANIMNTKIFNLIQHQLQRSLMVT